MIVLKYQDSTTENSLKTLGETYFFLFGGGWGPNNFQKKIGSDPNMEDSPNLYFMFFDRYEIQIQVGVLFSNGKCIIFQSSSPQNIFLGNLKHILKIIFFSKNGGYTFQTFRNFPNFQILRYQKNNIFKDASMIVLVFFEVFW